MKVEVIGNYQVAHAGTVYRPGDVADVPDEIAQRWISSGWVKEPSAGAPASGAGPPGDRPKSRRPRSG